MFNNWKKKSKYGQVKTDGMSSKLEAAVHRMLIEKQMSGLIKDVKSQQRVLMTKANIAYRVDFSYETLDGVTVWVEAKGFQTDVWRIKKRLWKHYGPGKLEIYTGNYKSPKLTETVEASGETQPGV